MIRFADINDIDDIMKFIDIHWKKNHILAVNKNFFCYQHIMNNEVTYVIARNDLNDEIDAILGYIPYGKLNRDVMLALWKANSTNNPTLGMELLVYLKENVKMKNLACIGINKKTYGIYKYLGFNVGKMTQWYRLNKSSDYKVSVIEDETIPVGCCEKYEFRRYRQWDDLLCDFDFNIYYENIPKPLKEDWYIKKRYFEHPIFKYEIYGYINKLNKVETLYIFRKIKVNDSFVLRFIDCIGRYTNIEKVTSLLDNLLVESKAEYVDCYVYGLPDKLFYEAGWKKTIETRNIIPDYFSPFVQQNIDIHYCTLDSEIVLFKGDGDQDRPN